MPGNFRPEESVPKKVYVPAKKGKLLFPRKVSNFLLGTHGFVRACPRARKSLYGSPKHSNSTSIKGALAPTVYAARRPVGYNLSSLAEYTTIPKLRSIRSSTHGPVNWQGLPSGYLALLCRSSQYRKFMLMCFCCT